MDLKSTRKEAIFKVGRNVLLFQQLEGVLKYLVSHGTFSAYQSELISKFKRQKKSVSKRTLGMVVGDFLSDPEPTPAPEKLREPHIIFRFTFEMQEDIKAQIEELVDERNHLVHHFLEGFDTSSVERWSAASASLDLQQEKLNRTKKYLQDLAQALSDGRKELAERMMTEEFRQQFNQKQ